MASEFTANSKTAYKSDYRSPARFIISHVRRHWLVAVALIIGAFSNAAFQSIVPIFIGQALNKLQDYENGAITSEIALQGIVVLIVLLIVSQIARALLQLMRNYSAETFGQRIERDVRDELYASLLGKSMTFHDMQPVGDIMARVTNDVRELYFMMNPGVNMVLGSGMFLIVPIFVAPTIHPQFILTPLVFVLLHSIVQVRFIFNLHPIAQKIRTSFGIMNTRLAEALEGLQVVKGTAQEANEKARFAKLTDTVRDYSIQQGEIEARYLSTLLWGLSFVTGMFHAGMLYRAGAITIGDFVSYIGLIYMFGFPVFVTLFSLSRLASGYASAKRILEIILTETNLDQNEEGYQGQMRGEIEFQNVTFAYGDGAPVLKDISFKVQPGQTVAIVGQTGAGKSSLTKLINRTYDATEGRVFVDSIDVRDWDLSSLRSQIGNIEQDIFLFSRTIGENIAFSDDAASPEQIEEAAKKAQAHDFITSFPESYQTIVGQRGVTLSGGQRQRLAIARAFESNPPVLILDDSTSAIDSATEDKIQKAIWTAAEGRTTLLITHRLSQIRWADHIIVLKQGKIAAQGKHEDLLQTSEAYRRIFARYDEPAHKLATEQA